MSVISAIIIKTQQENQDIPIRFELLGCKLSIYIANVADTFMVSAVVYTVLRFSTGGYEISHDVNLCSTCHKLGIEKYISILHHHGPLALQTVCSGDNPYRWYEFYAARNNVHGLNSIIWNSHADCYVTWPRLLETWNELLSVVDSSKAPQIVHPPDVTYILDQVFIDDADNRIRRHIYRNYDKYKPLGRLFVGDMHLQTFKDITPLSLAYTTFTEKLTGKSLSAEFYTHIDVSNLCISAQDIDIINTITDKWHLNSDNSLDIRGSRPVIENVLVRLYVDTVFDETYNTDRPCCTDEIEAADETPSTQYGFEDVYNTFQLMEIESTSQKT